MIEVTVNNISRILKFWILYLVYLFGMKLVIIVIVGFAYFFSQIAYPHEGRHLVFVSENQD